MEQFDQLLKDFDLSYFGSGKHKISFEKIIELKKENKVFVLDVRTKEELQCMVLNFAYNIPTDEVPDRIAEIPKDKTVAVFCTSTTRATMIYVYLKLNGYSDVKILANSIDEICGNFKPGFVLKNHEHLCKY